MTQLLFLLSDSRSGSTFLSRTLHNAFGNLVVTPELSLFWAVKCLDKGKRDRDSIVAALERGRFFETLETKPEDFPQQSKVTDEVFADFVRQNLAAFARKKWPERTVEKVVVKKGHHIWLAQSLKRLFPEAQFICLYRDPRAVYESKKRVERPYFPGETMAWAGVVVTTYRWRQYTEAMLALEKQLPSVHIQFEHLAKRQNEILMMFANQLALSPAERVYDDYQNRAAEKNVHERSVKDSIAPDAVADWQTKLSDGEIQVIECIADKSMATLDYEKTNKACGISGLFRTAVSLLYGLYAVLRRIFLRSAGQGE